MTRKGCAGHESCFRPPGKENTQLLCAAPHHLPTKSSAPGLPFPLVSVLSRAMQLGGQGRLHHRGYIKETGQDRRTWLHPSNRSPSCGEEPSPPGRMGIMCGGCFCPHARHHGKVTRTAAVVVRGRRDVVLGKRRHLSELSESIEVSSLWHR